MGREPNPKPTPNPSPSPNPSPNPSDPNPMTLPSTLTPTLTPALILSLTLEPVSLPRLQVERERRLDPAADADERRGARHLAQLDAGATP